jgi:hypothetical protein
MTVLVDEPDNISRLRDLDEIDALLKRKFPKEADLLIYYVTVESYVSLRNRVLGSYFIRSLCYVLDTYAMGENMELAHLLRKVNDKVATDFTKQMPQVCDQLRYHVYFNLNTATLPFLPQLRLIVVIQLNML